jgi:hypothetical protein
MEDCDKALVDQGSGKKQKHFELEKKFFLK